MRWTTFLAATTLMVYAGWAGAEGTAFFRDGDGLDLVRDGQPTSVIVVPRKALPVVRFAAEELQHHVKASTGAARALRGGLEGQGHHRQPRTSLLSLGGAHLHG